MRRVVVTGLGAITPLGVGARHSWSKLIAGHSGIVSVADFEPREKWKGLTSTVAGVVPKSGTSQDVWQPNRWLSATDQRRMSTFAQYAVAASEMALEDAAWKPSKQEDLEETGVCLGSGIGNLDDLYATALAYEQDGYKKVSPLFVPKILINMAAGHIAMKYGFQGPNHSATTACTTGAHSIGDASRFIAFGDADVMVAGGAESCIHPLAFAGFGRSRSLSTAFNHNPQASCRPFDSQRDGFVVAEGAAVVVLEDLEHAKARGARIYAELKGYGSSGDAFHMTAPREDGFGAFLAMKRALRHAEIKPSEVGYINAHATGTAIGDAAEASAIRSLMVGEEGYLKESKVTNIVPPTLNLYNTNVKPKFNLVPLEAQEKQVDVAISNSFGITPLRQDKILGGFMEKVGKVFAKTVEPYQVLKATETIYKACSRGALYTINPADLKAGTIPKTEAGEDLGEGSTMWHQEFNLPPTFSTWSQVTMLHMYLVYARLRNLEREAARSWHAQLVDHFFFDAEERMDLSHGISSRALRQRYLKDLFVQWRGVVVAYDEGVAKGDTVLASAVWRNVYKAREDVDVRALAAIVSWMRLCLKMLDQMSDEALFFHAETALRWPPKNELALVDMPNKELRDQIVHRPSPAS
ncbi:thiolase-like protein [Camillea tinctor]|nr:thiolase-like protein [Camillea tinctor]